MNIDFNGTNPGPLPPPVPARPGAFEQQQQLNGFGYNSLQNPYGAALGGYGGYGGGMYNSVGMGGMYGNGFGGFGGNPYGSGGGYGPGQSAESNFVRIAEEQSRGAFQSIESVINAVASVTNMLSSTHNAVFSSFRAVIGVVEQFSLLKVQVGGFLFVTLVRWLKWVWRTLLVHMGLKPANYNNQDLIWTDIQSRNPTAAEYLPGGQQAGFNWAAAIFWVIALGGPYLIYKAVSQMVAKVEESRKWATGDREHYTAQALFDFNASSPQELSFRKDDKLRIAPKTEQPQVRGWLLASSDDGQQVGLVPINYVKIVARQSASPPVAPRNPLDDHPGHQQPAPTSFQAAAKIQAADAYLHNEPVKTQPVNFDDFYSLNKKT